MENKPRHRGRHPADDELFAPERLPVLRTAVAELSWLLDRGYADTSALALVGNRHELRTRQRKAVKHCACGDRILAGRLARRQELSRLAGRALAIDGFNCLITLEAALAGGAILRGRDTAYRDMSSVHGSYHRVAETQRALVLVAEILAQCEPASVRWLLDRPVSNSGRLEALIWAAAPPGLPWHVELVYNPDRELCRDPGVTVASSDAWVIDHADAWVDLPGAVLDRSGIDAWILDLGDVGDLLPAAP